MSIGLDVGTYEMRSLRFGDERLIARRCRSIYSVLEATEAHHSILKQIDVPYAVCEDQLVIFGSHAKQLTQLFRVPRCELFPDGTIPSDNPPVRQLLATIIGSLIERSASVDDICCFTISGEVTSGGESGKPVQGFLSRLVELQGYRPLIIAASHALVLAELGSVGFTGVGLTFGANTCEAALVHRGIEMARCAVPFAGNWIDQRLARTQKLYQWGSDGSKYLDVARVQEWKERWTGNITHPVGRDEQQLADLYRGMVEFLLQEATAKLVPAMERYHLMQSMNVVIGGGSARIDGFSRLFEDVAYTMQFPVAIREIRPAADLSIARGCLIFAELESTGTFEEVSEAA